MTFLLSVVRPDTLLVVGLFVATYLILHIAQRSIDKAHTERQESEVLKALAEKDRYSR